MSAATRKTLTKTKNKSSAAWISNNNINKNQKEKQEDPLAIVNGTYLKKMKKKKMTKIEGCAYTIDCNDQ
jgi:hypothetical protein